MFLFPDISEWQTNADIEAILRKSNGHLIIRAGYGPHHKDKKLDNFRSRASGAKTLGMYHFVTKGGSVAANANSMISWVGKCRPNEFLVLDVENGSGNWTRSQCEDYMRRVQSACGGKVLIYANEAYAKAGGRLPLFTSTGSWVAKFSSTKPSIPYLIWQCSGTVNGKGVGSHITDWPGVGIHGDTNRVEVSESRFMELVLGSGSSEGRDFLDMADFTWYSMDVSKAKDLNKDSRFCIPWHNSSIDSVTNSASVMFGDRSYMAAAHVLISGEGRYRLEFGKVREGNTSWGADPDASLVSVVGRGDDWKQIICFDRNWGNERLRLWVTPLDEELRLEYAKMTLWHTDRK